MFACGHTDGLDSFGNGSMPQHIVRAGGCLNPPWFEPRQMLHVSDGFSHVPILICVHHESAMPANLFTNDCAAANIVFKIFAHFDLEMRPACGDGFTTEPA